MTYHPNKNRRADFPVWAGLVSVGALLLLMGCAPAERDRSEASSVAPQTIRQVDLALPAAAGDPATRMFDAGFARGALDADGEWRLRGEITHPRLRCGQYQLAVRFGTGDASCTRVDWRTQLLATPERRQCNGATLIHSGGGSLDLSANPLRSLNCARVLVRCTGACR